MADNQLIDPYDSIGSIGGVSLKEEVQSLQLQDTELNEDMSTGYIDYSAAMADNGLPGAVDLWNEREIQQNQTSSNVITYDVGQPLQSGETTWAEEGTILVNAIANESWTALLIRDSFKNDTAITTAQKDISRNMATLTAGIPDITKVEMEGIMNQKNMSEAMRYANTLRTAHETKALRNRQGMVMGLGSDAAAAILDPVGLLVGALTGGMSMVGTKVLMGVGKFGMFNSRLVSSTMTGMGSEYVRTGYLREYDLSYTEEQQRNDILFGAALGVGFDVAGHVASRGLKESIKGSIGINLGIEDVNGRTDVIRRADKLTKAAMEKMDIPEAQKWMIKHSLDQAHRAQEAHKTLLRYERVVRKRKGAADADKVFNKIQTYKRRLATETPWLSAKGDIDWELFAKGQFKTDNLAKKALYDVLGLEWDSTRMPKDKANKWVWGNLLKPTKMAGSVLSSVGKSTAMRGIFTSLLHKTTGRFAPYIQGLAGAGADATVMTADKLKQLAKDNPKVVETLERYADILQKTTSSNLGKAIDWIYAGDADSRQKDYEANMNKMRGKKSSIDDDAQNYDDVPEDFGDLPSQEELDAMDALNNGSKDSTPEYDNGTPDAESPGTLDDITSRISKLRSDVDIDDNLSTDDMLSDNPTPQELWNILDVYEKYDEFNPQEITALRQQLVDIAASEGLPVPHKPVGIELDTNYTKAIGRLLGALSKFGVDTFKLQAAIERARTKGPVGRKISDAAYAKAYDDGGAQAVLRMIAHNGSPIQRVMARRFLDTPSADVNDKINILFVGEDSTRGSTSFGESGYILSRPEFEQSGKKVDATEVLLHEIVHAHTMKYLNQDPKFAAKVTRLRNKAIANRDKLVEGQDALTIERIDYALQDNAEFLAVPLADMNVAMRFNEVKMGKQGRGKSLFDYMSEFIHTMFGGDRSLMTEVMEVTDRTLMAGKGNPIASLKNIYDRQFKGKKDRAMFLEHLESEWKDMLDDIVAHPEYVKLTPEQQLKVQADFMDMRDGTIGFIGNTMSKENKRAETGHKENWRKVSAAHIKELGPLRQKLHDQFSKPLQQLISKSFGIFTESLSSRMIRSKSALAEWAAFNIFNVPSGTGGMISGKDSATLVQRNMMSLAMHNLNQARVKALFEYAADKSANALDRATIRTSQVGDNDMVNDFYKAVYLEINDRRLGKTSDRPSYIKDYADAIKKNNSDMYDLQLKHKITGITGDNKMEHYIQQNVNREHLTAVIEKHGKADVIKLFRDSLVKGGDPKDALAKAEAMIDDIMKREEDNSFNLIDLISKRELPDGMTIWQVLGIKSMPESGKQQRSPSYVNKRTYQFDFDTTRKVEGGELSMLDIFDYDVSRMSEEYTTKATGLSAMSFASNGNIRSYADIEDMLEVMKEESEAAGTTLNINDVRQEMRIMLGMPTDSMKSNDLTRLMTSASLKMLGGLPEAQLADAGAIAAKGQAGIVGAWHALKSGKDRLSSHIMGTQLSADAQANIQHMNDLQELTGFIEDAHLYANQGVDLQSKEADRDAGLLRDGLNMATGGQLNNYLQYLQTRYSGFAAVRSALQQANMATALEVYVKHMRGEGNAENRLKHVGFIDQQGNLRFEKYFKDGTVQFDKNNRISSLNLDKWSDSDRTSLGAVLTRAVGDDTIEAFHGELAPELRKPFMQFLFQFQSIPMLAAEKFQARELKFGDKQAAVGVLTNVLFAGMGRYIRYQSMSMAMHADDRDEYLERSLDGTNMLTNALAYTNVVGVLPLINNYTQIITGNSEYGEGRVGGMLSALPVWTAVTELGGIGGVQHIIEGDLPEARKHFALGTMAAGNALTGIAVSLID